MQKPTSPIYALDIEQALAAYQSTKHGLHANQAAQRIRAFGPNTLPIHKQSLFKRIIEPFTSIFVGMLLVALILSIIEGKAIDAIIVGVIVAVNALIYYAQQYSVSRVLRTLSQHDIVIAHVIRDGKTIQVPSEQLTYGDVVHLSEGMKVPADGRLIDASQLECDEAILTGESLPVHKHAAAIAGDPLIYAQKNMAFKGTYVRSGSGLLLITGIGSDTQLGTITALAGDADTAPTPIEQKIDSLIKHLVLIIIIVALATLGLALYRGIAFDESLRFMIAIVVSAIPEGLPVALTIVLLLSARRMAQVNALVKKMSSIETMGAVTLIATDKTGTLTANKLSVAEKHTTHPSHATFDQVILASLNQAGDHASDSLDQLLAESVRHAHIPVSWERIRNFPFDQALRVSGVLWRREHDYLLVVKGSPESVLEHTLLRHRQDAATQKALETFTSNGYRTIAFAHRVLTKPAGELHHHIMLDMGFDGFIGMTDQIRPDVATAVQEAHRAGINVVMLTGDHVATAKFIAQQTGISHDSAEATDSTVLASGNNQDILTSLKYTKVFGRVLPEHKYALLQATKGHEITAMTGDGVNDIPALVEADAGISMGSGSDAAKDASDIVLLDNNFHSIVAAIKIGRTALANIRKMIGYLLGTSLGEVSTMLLALAFGVPLPVAAVQILWINLVTDGATVIPLGLSPPEEHQMLQSPRSPSAPLLDLRQLTRVVLMGVTMSVVILTMYAVNLSKGQAYAQTLAFLSLIVMQWANALNANVEYKSWIYTFLRPNVKLIVAIGASIILQAVVFLTPLGQFLGVVPVSLADAITAIVIPTILTLCIIDIHKFISHKVLRRHAH